MKHVMIDIETFSTGRDAAIASFGAVKFCLERGVAGPEGRFYQVVDLARSNDPGEIDAATVLWWLGQHRDAQQALLSSDAVNLRTTLERFSAFCEGAECVWSNGPLFDERIVREAYHRHKMKFPFHYRGSRCCRTYYALAHELRVSLRSPPEGVVKHHALDDAILQAGHMVQVHAAIRGGARP
jgi:hypothetical protein